MTWTLDAIAELAPSADLKNALHACRDGHPLGKGQAAPFRSAALGCAARWQIPSDAIYWLEAQANARGEPTFAELLATRRAAAI